jgi:quinoprotein glucose dehydrogenase
MAQVSLRRPNDLALAAAGGLSVLALLDSLFNYVWTGNGIHGTEGALLVIVSTLLMAVAIAIVLGKWGPRWLHVLLEVLIVLDFIGTGAAAYLLQAWFLLALVVLAFIAWLAHTFRPAPRPTPTLG